MNILSEINDTIITKQTTSKKEMLKITETIFNNYGEIRLILEQGKIDKVFQLNTLFFRFDEVKKPDNNLCQFCGGSQFVFDGDILLCRGCGKIGQHYHYKINYNVPTSKYTGNIGDKLGYSSTQMYKYNKPKLFIKYIKVLRGTWPISLPVRYFYLFRNHLAQNNINADKLTEKQIVRMIKVAEVYKFYKKYIPAIYYVMTGKYFINISDEQLDEIVAFYSDLLEVSNRELKEKMAPCKFMIRKMIKYLKIEIDLSKIGAVKGVSNTIKMEAKWNRLISKYEEMKQSGEI